MQSSQPLAHLGQAKVGVGRGGLRCGVGALAQAPTLPPTPGTHFGLAQVRERLATLHGSAGTLDLIATSAGGTSASVRFPLNIQHP